MSVVWNWLLKVCVCLDKAVANIENERTMYGLAYEARKFNGERDYVWPLPTAELDTNKKLVQHDLWK